MENQEKETIHENFERINITNSLFAFQKHLENNNRTIFSAKFGDGKTYFLKEFKHFRREEYAFITLYPVNYQIAENKAIFEYIKRDILIQMITQEMIEPAYEIPDSLKLQFYVMNNSGTLIKNLIDTIPSLGLPEEKMGLFLAACKGLSSIFCMSQAISKYKKAIDDHDDEALIQSFLDKHIKEKGSPYEIDLITHIIIHNISWYKETYNKKVILIIEDLDRLDPAHLFRILNVFSAHIDRVYQLSTTQEESSEGFPENSPNKFGFDNVITVFDNEIAERTFKYFYGEDANYTGYISKFLSSAPFYYSIKKLAQNQFYEFVKKECFYSVSQAPNAIQDLFNEISIRDMFKIKNKYLNRIRKEYYPLGYGANSGKELFISTFGPFTKLVSILLLINKDKEDLKHRLREIRRFPLSTVQCLGVYTFVSHPISSLHLIMADKCKYQYNLTFNKDTNIIIDCSFKEIVSYNSEDFRISTDDIIKAFDIATDYIDQ